MFFKSKQKEKTSIVSDEGKFPVSARFLLIPPLQSYYVVFHSIWFLIQLRKCRSENLREDEVDRIHLSIKRNQPIFLLAIATSLLFSYLYPPEWFINWSTYAVAHLFYGLWIALNSPSHFLQ